ncbi:hypothetical protein Sango_3016700 [Sesamum angolense]|uniref:Integrase catalytic domain-containing protein n=1 Tax=Sesamum angolense TaxID=2727404 RepID=A0AAE1T2A5_9LAMI|nr:hypothetical protein Sango_3016700 [Sesamum angolense]
MVFVPIAMRKGIARGIVPDSLPSKPLKTQTRGGFSYFITFIDDHSRYGYVYMMRYKFEAFVRFKELRLEVENQTGLNIKTLRLDRGGEYLSGDFLDYLKKNSIVSQCKPPGIPQLNGMAERRKWTLFDMVRSMMSFTELSFLSGVMRLRPTARLLNIAPSKAMAQTPYQIWHGKPASYRYLRVLGSPTYIKRLLGDKLNSISSLCRNAVFLERGFSADTRRNELLPEESSDAHAGTLSASTVSIDNVPILRRSVGMPEPPESYGFLGVTGQLDNDPKTYGEVMSDINLGKWLEAIKFEIDCMGSNQVWTLVDQPKGVQLVGCKWVYKCKISVDGEFHWEEIYMDQSEEFTIVGEEQKVCHLQRSIYGLKQASRSWNICFDEVIRGYDFIKNEFTPWYTRRFDHPCSYTYQNRHHVWFTIESTGSWVSKYQELNVKLVLIKEKRGLVDKWSWWSGGQRVAALDIEWRRSKES